MTPPNLLAVLHASACWGRCDVDPGQFLDHVFGDILCQILAGDFLQLNPVRNHSLMGAFGIDVPGVPLYEKMDPVQRQKKQELDEHGYNVFRKFMKQTVLFRGSHRFKKGDPLATLLEKMRQVGGVALSQALKDSMSRQIYRPLAGDARLASDYCMYDDKGLQIGPKGFFARGVFSAVNWDQVARLQHVCAYESARATFGCSADHNTSKGKPRIISRGFPMYLSRSFNAQYGKCMQAVASRMIPFMHFQGQLLYYVQAVDLIHQREFGNDASILRDILNVTNMASKTGNLISFLPLHIGLKVKITKKLLPPEIVQECPCEVIGIQMHPNERFGSPGHAPGQQVPHPGHSCWSTGYVRLDYLPAAIAVRVEDRSDDYTGRALPGVYLLEPSEDTFNISLRRRGELHLDVTRIQFPLAPLAAGTFNNSQGKTVRDQGHTIDCTRPSYFSRDVYIQHLYMILGRAQALQYSLFRNFPTTENGDVDWSLFENGPPQYIADFLHRLEEVASVSSEAIEAARRFLPPFPMATSLPRPDAKNADGMFVYARGAWESAVQLSASSAGHCGKKRKFQPMQWKELRRDFCLGLGCEQVPEVADPTKLFFWNRCHLRAFAADAGGGGDCFFLSVAAILIFARDSMPAVVDSLGLSPRLAAKDRKAVAQALRGVVGRHFRKLSGKAFVDFVAGCVAREKAGAWMDQWSMLALLRKSPFEFLATVNVVVDVQVLDDALQVRFQEGESLVTRSKRIRGGVAALAKLQHEVALQLETCGNRHWATDVDIAALSDELNVSFIIAGNTWTNTQVATENIAAGKVLHAYVGVKETPCLWLCLYYIDEMHFQVLLFEKDGECHCYFPPDALPPTLLEAVAACR